MLKTISLFTGAGGLDLGLEAAGFEPALCVEVDQDARQTLALNRPGWNLLTPGDILRAAPADLLDQSGLRPHEAALVVAGPVCQPFSHAARWVPDGARGLADPRAVTLRACLDVLEVALPQALLLENVGGFVAGGDGGGLAYVRSRLQHINAREGTKYNAVALPLNSAHYGVPQVRRRTFIVADRDGRTLLPPDPSHGDRGEHVVTAWDALGDLDGQGAQDAGHLALAGKWASLLPSIPEGCNYLWHTSRGGGVELFGWRTRYWTFLLKLAKNRPSWTLTAHPGPATGPFHWRNRRLSVREMCRLQTFPDGYEIAGSYPAQRRQVGNAVPCLLAEVVAGQMAVEWFGMRRESCLAHRMARRGPCPPPEPVERVHSKYSWLVGSHESHPGAGRGPASRARAREAANA